jgi:hypothetical protein
MNGKEKEQAIIELEKCFFIKTENERPRIESEV